jgi:hypothetical protein
MLHPRRSADIDELRGLARNGALAGSATRADADHLARLRGALYELAWPLVFERLTKRLELRRGHTLCAQGLDRIAPECLDRFHDDVEAVVDDALRWASGPINNLEGWISTRLVAATVNGHRRRRGERGALQRPRIPAWLKKSLDADPWLCELSVGILTWVGVPVTAGAQLWPLDSWAAHRAGFTGDWAGSDVATVEREIKQVLSAMQSRPVWYANHVERPLGRKQPPVVCAAQAEALAPLALVPDCDLDEARLVALAELALEAMKVRLARGEDQTVAVTAVIHALFGADTSSTGRTPNGEDRLATLLADPAEVDRIVGAVLTIIATDE